MAKFITIYDKELDDTVAINLDKVYFVREGIDPQTTFISFDGELVDDPVVWTVEKKNGNTEYYISKESKTMLLNMPLDQVLKIIYETIR